MVRRPQSAQKPPGIDAEVPVVVPAFLNDQRGQFELPDQGAIVLKILRPQAPGACRIALGCVQTQGHQQKFRLKTPYQC